MTPPDPFGDDWIGNVWRAAVLESTGRPITPPSRGETRKLVSAIATHAGTEALKLPAREDWLRSKVAAWAKGDPKRTIFGFVDWLDGGEVSRDRFGKPVAAEKPYSTMSEPARTPKKTKAQEAAELDAEIEAARREGRIKTGATS